MSTSWIWHKAYVPCCTVVIASASSSGISIENSYEPRISFDFGKATWTTHFLNSHDDLYSIQAIEPKVLRELGSRRQLHSHTSRFGTPVNPPHSSKHPNAFSTHLLRLDLLEALEHVEHARLNGLLGQPCGGRVSSLLLDAPRGDGGTCDECLARCRRGPGDARHRCESGTEGRHCRGMRTGGIEKVSSAAYITLSPTNLLRR